ncbi:unnamed protein product [Cuscuta campestris]|uniref:Uncharacterized protein n=1 Tax=Cuscuta campestris TaxID=132261 RepID=A0A484MYM4_9ASTE|nr:unnamed protein product [Cuscuta campestris]
MCALSYGMGVSKSTIHRWLELKQIRRHSNAIKPLLCESEDDSSSFDHLPQVVEVPLPNLFTPETETETQSEVIPRVKCNIIIPDGSKVPVAHIGTDPLTNKLQDLDFSNQRQISSPSRALLFADGEKPAKRHIYDDGDAGKFFFVRKLFVAAWSSKQS